MVDIYQLQDEFNKFYGSYENLQVDPHTGAITVIGDLFLTIDQKEMPNFNIAQLTGHFYGGFNRLKSLKHSPRVIGKNFYIHDNPLENFHGAPEEVNGEFIFTWNENLALLPLLKIKGSIDFSVLSQNGIVKSDISNILNKYKTYGLNAMVPCAAALAKAGYRENARL